MTTTAPNEIALTQTAADFAADIVKSYGEITAETVKATLSRYKEAYKRYTNALSICNEYESKVSVSGSGTPQSSTGVTNQHDNRSTENKYIKLAALNERCEALRIAACNEFGTVDDIIRLLPFGVECDVLFHRYLLNDRSWKDIAAAMEYTERNTMRLHKKALSRLADILNAEAVKAGKAWI